MQYMVRTQYTGWAKKSKPQAIYVYDVNNTIYICNKNTDILYVDLHTNDSTVILLVCNVIYSMVLNW